MGRDRVVRLLLLAAALLPASAQAAQTFDGVIPLQEPCRPYQGVGKWPADRAEFARRLHGIALVGGAILGPNDYPPYRQPAGDNSVVVRTSGRESAVLAFLRSPGRVPEPVRLEAALTDGDFANQYPVFDAPILEVEVRGASSAPAPFEIVSVGLGNGPQGRTYDVWAFEVSMTRSYQYQMTRARRTVIPVEGPYAAPPPRTFCFEPSARVIGGKYLAMLRFMQVNLGRVPEARY